MAVERSLKVISNETTFFNKVSSTLTKLLIPTRVGINGIMINMKRSSVLKSFEQLNNATEINDIEKIEHYNKRYEESYALYLEAIDKYIMDSIYKKVKNNTASVFEKDALSDYYTIVHLKENEYIEYKYRKQKFLLDLDYESLNTSKKEKILKKYSPVYVQKCDSIYKGILKNYSVKLVDGLMATKINQIEIYKKIFGTLEDYIRKILPIKLKIEGEEKYSKIIDDYENYERFDVGKLDEKDFLEKNMILLALSRSLFTHSLPLVAAEQCYKKLLKDTRTLIMNSKSKDKKEAVYKMLLKLIEDYNVKLLSTKVYWENSLERENYKKFWDLYSKTGSAKEKEILSIKRELHDTNLEYEKYSLLRKYYKQKLVELGAMRNIRNSTKTLKGYFTKL